MIDSTKLAQACARVAHEVNRAYCLAVGDESQAPWDDAPEWQRLSAVNGVAGALAGNTPEQSHESWLAEKRATGWKYGSVKDIEKKEHPCFVPYAELSSEQQHKDLLFTSTVRAVAKAFSAMCWCDKHAVAEPCQFCPDERIIKRLGDEMTLRSQMQIERNAARHEISDLLAGADAFMLTQVGRERDRALARVAALETALQEIATLPGNPPSRTCKIAIDALSTVVHEKT